jgi:formylglycine-generating enzyme required for sulfatase activity
MSDTAPTVGSASASGAISNPGANVANYDLGADWNGQDGNVTTIGSATSMSFYGAFDMGGNVSEWHESEILPRFRGGGWRSFAFDLRSSSTRLTSPATENDFLGFRVASIPEPASCSLMLVALVTLGCRRMRE